jgi:hypothetical protein
VKKKNFAIDYAFLGGMFAGSFDYFIDDREEIYIRGIIPLPSMLR